MRCTLCDESVVGWPQGWLQITFAAYQRAKYLVACPTESDARVIDALSTIVFAMRESAPVADEKDCWLCSGTGLSAIAGVACPKCDGTGVTPRPNRPNLRKPVKPEKPKRGLARGKPARRR